MKLPDHIKQWFFSRTVTEKVLEDFNIGWDGKKIVFPIYSPENRYLFSKYRRDPASDEGPKYTYDAGSTAALYGANKIPPERGSIIICEGEGDLLTLYSHGYVAVSTTGGAGTWKDEWTLFLKNKDIYILYDNDEAGIKGAVKLLTKFPAKLVLIPRSEGVKDVTNYFQKGGSLPLLLEAAQSFYILCEPLPEFKNIRDREEQIKKYKDAIKEYHAKITDGKNNHKPFHHFEAINQLLLNGISNLERGIRRIRYLKNEHLKHATRTYDSKITDDDIQRAKDIPIDAMFAGPLRKLGKRATGNCPFHEETTGSFTIYLDQNKFYCFGCSAGTDAIDFVMRRDSCTFIEAVKKMLNK